MSAELKAKALAILSALVLESGRRWAEVAELFQLRDAEAILTGERPFHFLTRSRGGSKTTDLVAVAIALLLTLPPRSRLYWVAADAEQGQLAIDAMAGFAARTPSLAGALTFQTRRVGCDRTDSTLEVLPADSASAWGLQPAFLFADELAQWPDVPNARRLWEAVSSAAAKRSDSGLAVLTTAGSPSHFAYKVLEHARTSNLWHVHEHKGPAPWLAADRLEEQRQRLPDAIYRQLFENEWVEGAGTFLDPAVIEAAFTLDGPSLEAESGRSGYVAGLDLGHVRDRSVFALICRRGGEFQLERMQVWTPSKARPVDYAEIERFVTSAHARYRFKLRFDSWQALSMAQSFRRAGISAEEFTFNTSSKQKLASTLLHSLNVGELKLYDAEGLREELLGLRLKQAAGGSWSFDHASTGHDDRAVALAMALVASVEGGGHTTRTVSRPRGRVDPILEGPGGMVRTGTRYLDRGPDGRLKPPPGWELINRGSIRSRRR